MVTWSHDHHMIHHIRQRSLFDRFACMVNKIKCETYLPESQVVIWFITSSKIICDLISLRSGEWVMVLHSIWCYCHMCNHDIIYFVHILCSRAASKWLLLSGMRGRSNQSESNDSIDFIWILGHQMMSLHMIPETTFAVSILSVTLMADKALQHMWDGENQLLVSFKSWPFENLWHEMCKDRFKSPGPHVEVVQPDRHMVMNESKKPLFGKEHVDCKHISQMSMTSWTMPWTEQITALRIGFIFSQDRSMKSPASLYKSKWIN